jgi:cell division protein FtsZ
VGDTVDEFASSDATVVIGMVIDPDLGDELKVTIVATGLGGAAQTERPMQAVPASGSRVPTPDSTGYSEYDKPLFTRRKAQARAAEEQAPIKEKEEDVAYLDIPAFLRRQAD